MKTLKNWTLHQQADHFVELKVEDRHFLRLYVLEDKLMRVLLKRDGELALNRTWSIALSATCPGRGGIVRRWMALRCRHLRLNTMRSSCASARNGCVSRCISRSA